MWKDLLSFTRKEQYGILALMILIIISILIRIIIPYFIKYPDFSDIVEDVTEYIVIEDNDTKNDVFNSKIKPFNPNKVTKTQLISYGISENISENWTRYIDKGGKFYKKEDVKKIFGITSEIYEAIYPYLKIEVNKNIGAFEKPNKDLEYINLNRIDYTYLKEVFPEKDIADSIYYYAQNFWFPNKIEKTNFLKWNLDSLEKIKPFLKDKFSKKEIVSVDINLADTLEWMSLNGIGPVLSKRIISYRNKLGGFVKSEQLLEVYGINKEVYDKIKDNLKPSTNIQRKINVNNATVNQLKQHPYISFYTAKYIVDKRLEKGRYSSVEEIYDPSIFDDVEWEMIRHYLGVE